MRMSDKQIRNNQRYNAERKAQAELMKRDLDRDRALAQIYQESFDRMQREIDGFYMRYASKEGLTKQEAMKRVSEMDVTKFNAKAAKAVKEKDFSHATNEWLKVYNLKMKVSRLELLRAELTLEIQNLTAEVNEVFDKARTDEYLNEYKRQAGILGISSSGAKKRMQAILDADFYEQKFSSRVWGGLGLRATLQREVFGSLNRIFTDMMGYKQEMKRLAKKYGTSEQNAKRLLKTEIARINADTQYNMLKDNGFTHMIFVAEPGACDLCGPLDKVAVPIDKVEKGVNMYPMHPNCRCSSYGHIKMDYKAGGSTLDREAPNGVWGEDEQTEAEKTSQKQISGTGRKLLAFEEDEIFVASNPDEIDAFFEKQKSYQEWYNKVEKSPEKKEIINAYTTMEGQEIFNKILRDGLHKYEQEYLSYFDEYDKPYAKQVISERLERNSKLIDILGDYTSEKPFVTYRGTRTDEGYYNKLKVGEVTSIDKGFLSTSLDRNIALDFSNDGAGDRYLFDIRIPKGSNKGAYIAKFSDMLVEIDEKEFLLQPNSKFKVLSIEKNSSGLNLISLELQND
ncbi:TPA: minor capsid protein [Streptococcus suis]|nr:minor capsid protein [Streptococcus suis]